MINKIISDLKSFSNPEKAEFFPKFFDTKTGETDTFIGVTVPNTRLVAKRYFQEISVNETFELLKNDIHEIRLLALFILCLKFKKAKEEEQKEIVDLYLKHTKYINNWDLVDTSAYFIIGKYLLDKPRDLLYKLAKSSDLWEQRISIVATMMFIRKGQVDDTYQISDLLLDHKHHYIHKAVGWLLREAGKKDEKRLVEFLKTHYTRLPRTTLRYAIERFSPETRKKYLEGRF